MSNIKNILVELWVAYSPMGRKIPSKMLKSQENSLDSKIAEVGVHDMEISREIEIVKEMDISKDNIYIDKSKKIKNTFLNYFKNAVTLGYNKFIGKFKKDQKIRTQRYNSNKNKNPLNKLKKSFLMFYFMLPSKYDPNRESYLKMV